MNSWLKQLVDFRGWLTTGAAWHWYSLTTVSLSGLLLVALFFLVTSQGLSYFWPDAVDEWIVTGVVADSEPTGSSGTQRLFATMLEQRQVDIPRADGDILTVRGQELLLEFQVIQGDTFDRRYQWFSDHRIVRVSRPESILEVSFKDGRRVYGYPLVLNLEQPVEGRSLTQLLRNNGWREILQQNDLDEIVDQPIANTAELVLRLQNGDDLTISLDQVRQLVFPNEAGWSYRLGQFLQNIWAFLSTGPMPDYQGGILTAIYGTVLLVLLMTIILVPLGVITAVYLHEYASNNLLTKILRIAISNLAGIPGIVYGVFVLGVFVYGMGAQLDKLFFSDNLPLPTFGAGGLLWASLALALLTLPVVIVATEEGLARVPNDLRRGALALGATRSEMIWGTVVNAASPAILTGLILAIARAAGEVAPLLLVGAVKYTGQPLIQGEFPFVHVERQFMHLGYQVYDFALQSTNAHASVPLAYATTLILLALVVLLNLVAIRLRARLRRRFLVDFS